jgi:mRNA-binding protein PUF3
MQKALIKSIDKQQQLNIIYLILQNTHQLITNQFGNYLYQSLIFMNDDCIIVKICEIISNNFIKYCKEKYSSNVVEKLFDIPNQRLLNKIALIICENSETILDLVTDQYGNYIIQKILNNANCEYITNLILRVISNHYSQVVKTSLGKKIVMKINNSLNPKQKV